MDYLMACFLDGKYVDIQILYHVKDDESAHRQNTMYILPEYRDVIKSVILERFEGESLFTYKHLDAFHSLVDSGVWEGIGTTESTTAIDNFVRNILEKTDVS